MMFPDFACIFIKKNTTFEGQILRKNAINLLITIDHLIILLHASRKFIETSIKSPNIEQKRNVQDAFNSEKVIFRDATS